MPSPRSGALSSPGCRRCLIVGTAIVGSGLGSTCATLRPLSSRDTPASSPACGRHYLRLISPHVTGVYVLRCVLALCPETNLKLCLLLALLLKPVFLNNGVAPGVLGGILCRARAPSLIGTCPLISRCSLLHSCKNRRCSFCSLYDVRRRNGLWRFGSGRCVQEQTSGVLSLVAFWRPVLALALTPFVEHGLWVVAIELFDPSLPLCLRSDLVAMPLRVAAVPPSPLFQPMLAVVDLKQELAVSDLDLAPVSVLSRGWLGSSLLRLRVMTVPWGPL